MLDKRLLIGLALMWLGLLIGAIIVLGAGQTQAAFQAGTPSAGPTPTLPPSATPLPDWFPESAVWGSPVISPDGQWVASVRSNQPIQVWRADDPDTIITDDQPLGPYTFFRAWFPDSTAFVIVDSDRGCEKCRHDRLIVYAINGGALERFVYEPLAERNRAFWSAPVWSPAGDQMAVIVGGREIHVLDRAGRPIKTLTAQVTFEGDHIDEVAWTTWGLIYSVRYLPGFPSQEILIYRDSSDAIGGDELLFSGYDYPRILSADYDSPRLIIHHGTNRPGFPHSGEIVILNTETHELEDVLLTHDDQYPYYHALDAEQGHALALTDRAGHLYIYDWRANELRDKHLRVGRLVQWRQDLGALVVMRSPENLDHYTWADSWLEAVAP